MASNTEDMSIDDLAADDTTETEEGPVLRGTIFLTILLLMLIFGFWAMMYLFMIER